LYPRCWEPDTRIGDGRSGTGSNDAAKATSPSATAWTQAQLEVKLAAHDDRIERKIADMVQTLDVAKRAGLTAQFVA
jgi:hypothetical protein